MAGSTRRSLQELSAEVATNPKSTAFVELAAAYRERGDLQRALWLCLRGLQRHPTHVEAHFELARIYEERGERELALDELAIVRQLAPDHLRSRLALIEIYLEEGKRSEAERELQAAEELALHDPTVMQLRSRFRVSSRKVATSRAQGVFDALAKDYPGTVGAMLIEPDGAVIAGHIPAKDGKANVSLAENLSGARQEANRVASYLQLGEVRTMIVESASARITVSPLGERAIVVATSSDVPAGQATRVGRKAAELARSYLNKGGR
jgi:predicted regulator of Ras-like GTPase activity (Roadblock/LC7/MglB family)